MSKRIIARALAIVALAAFAVDAQAHARLVKSVPADKGQVAAFELLQLEFSDTLQITALTLTRRGAAAATPIAAPAEWGSSFSIRIAPPAPGDYVLKWSATTEDGHLASGQIQFTVVPAVKSGTAP